MVAVKRAYDKASADDGTRLLVDRLWPRGVRKTDLLLDGWIQDVAPSDSLRRWFGHNPSRWPEFRKRYFAELDRHPEAWAAIRKAAAEGRVTLVFAARDPDHNNAVALKEYIEQHMGRKRSRAQA